MATSDPGFSFLDFCKLDIAGSRVARIFFFLNCIYDHLLCYTYDGMDTHGCINHVEKLQQTGGIVLRPRCVLLLVAYPIP